MQAVVAILESRPPDDHPAYLQDLREELDEMAGLVGELLAFSRALHGRPPVLASIDLRAVVDRAWEREGREEIPFRNAVPDSLRAKADAQLLQRAIANLLRNAVEAVPVGGVVVLRVAVEESRIAFYVEDNGPGIHLQPGEDLLNPFFSKKEGGTGLGLNIVHRIVTAHGGNVDYGNRPQGGAWFRATLPISYGEGA